MAKKSKKKPAPKKKTKSTPKKKPGKKVKASASDLIKVIPAASLKSLETELKGLRAKKDGAADAVKKRIQKASSTQHLNTEAFALYEKVKKKDDKKLAVFMAHFEHLCEVGGINKRATAQGELFARPEIGEKEPAKPVAAKPRPSVPSAPKPSASASAPKEIPFDSQANGDGTRTLTRPTLVPTAAAIKEIAERAANRG